MDWEEFEKRLFDQLVTLPERVICVIGQGDDQEPFIQFAGVHAFHNRSMEIIAGFQDDTMFDRKFTPEEEALFVECDFERRGTDPTYWEQDIPWPPSGQALAKVLRSFMVRLRDIAAIPSPDELTYVAWKNAGYGIGQYSEEYYGKERNFTLHQLGLRKVET
ncbi:hypothetical protein EII34_13725 [Arachnia propionica]|uniref:TY-Chap N-terminal domain-containing protein n=1 Tax=Arachnia propionica TaxID=1750 RepID=A0A3P1T2P7_9ACTN|nr:hypothetical protein [Arachnia propionica]MDO5084366.1 hypothetical protein [Arachnia propionica]RRD03639.1 hypothetical protein EII34_13725 [Arachnia propionica]